MQRRLLAATIVLSAISTLSIQVAGLVSLQVIGFGFFSVVYLVGAFGLSFQLSFLSEAWGRNEVTGDDTERLEYTSVSFYLALIFGILAGVLCWAVPQLSPLWWLSIIAVASTIYKDGLRYFALRGSDWRRVLLGDSVHSIVGVAGGVVVFLSYRESLTAIFALWACASFVSAAVFMPSKLAGPKVLISWFQQRKKSISMLLKDSLILNCSSIGTPYILAPLLGMGNFGVYRAVSNVSSPVRLIMNAIRPRIANIEPRTLFTLRSTFLLVTLAACVGASAYLALVMIDQLDINLGTLSELRSYALIVSMYVSAVVLSQTYYIIARYFADHLQIMIGRWNQAIFTSLLPIIGAVYYGLSGAILMYAIGILVSAVVWGFVSSYSQG